MNGQVLQQGLLQGCEPVGVEVGVHNKLEVWGFVDGARGRFDEEVLGGWI